VCLFVQGTFVAGTAMEGKVTVTFTGTQVPIEVKVTDEALAAGAAKLSAALTEAMKEGHNKSVQLQQTKLK
jgi:DNA-binding protein YbaB